MTNADFMSFECAITDFLIKLSLCKICNIQLNYFNDNVNKITRVINMFRDFIVVFKIISKYENVYVNYYIC